MNQIEPVAIVGIGCRFPGGANGWQSFWNMLRNGTDCIRKIPKDRWDIASFFDPRMGLPDKTYSKWGGFIDRIDEFDPGFFSISRREAALMDPQQRLLLEVSWEALEDAGQVLDGRESSNTGVFIGISTSDYALIQSRIGNELVYEPHSTTGSVMSMVANRISFCLDMSGPSIAVDTACSSSLVAVHLACRSLLENSCETALAGGVNLMLAPDPYIGFSAMSLLSPDGRCKAFDAGANGFVPGEGAGVIVLKRLSDAMAAGDRIYALIRATGVNQDGRTSSISLPSQKAQARLFRQVCEQAQINAADVGYVEAHGTGTFVGDPMEAGAIGEVFGNRPATCHPCLLGSVKTNIGHLEAAAGIAGIIKTALVLRHRIIPPSLHFSNPNPRIEFEKLRLEVVTSPTPWPGDNVALAAVNSFGFGGANAHALLQGPPEPVGLHATPERASGVVRLFALSAKSDSALEKLAGAHAASLRSGAAISFRDYCYTAAVRRVHHDIRLTVAARSKDELAERLEAFQAGERHAALSHGRRSGRDLPKIAFVYSGQGPQWWKMGCRLLEEEPVFYRMIRKCDEALGKLGGWSLLEELRTGEADSRMHVTAIAQPAIFSIQMALTDLWRSWGIVPDAVMGHSVGEVAAACVSKALGFEDAVEVIFHRGRLMEWANAKGKMLAANLSEQDALSLIDGCEGRVSLAAVNSPSWVTLSGESEAMAEISGLLDERKVFCKYLRIDYAFHSEKMEPVRKPLQECLRHVKPGPNVLPVFSTVTGQEATGRIFDADYWWRNIRQPVRFSAAAESLVETGHTVFVELSPHPVLSGYLSECLGPEKGRVLPSLRRNGDDREVMLGSLGALHSMGLSVNWRALYPEGRIETLPPYPWDREPLWNEPKGSRELRLGLRSHPLLGFGRKGADPTWLGTPERQLVPYLEDHRLQGQIVFPAAGYLEMALGLAREMFSDPPWLLEEIEFHKALFLWEEDDPSPELQTICYPEGSAFKICSRPKRDTGRWTLRADGKVLAHRKTKADLPADLDAVRGRCGREISIASLYDSCKRAGFDYGPAFQGVRRIGKGRGEAFAEVLLPDSLLPETDKYLVHPALLDACLHVFVAGVSDDSDDSDDSAGLKVPVYVERFCFHRGPGTEAISHGRILNANESGITGDISIYDGQGRLCIEIRGLRCKAIQESPSRKSERLDNAGYEIQWHLAPPLRRDSVGKKIDSMPALASLALKIQPFFENSFERPEWPERFETVRKQLRCLCAGYVKKCFGTLAWEIPPDEKMSVDLLVKRLNISEEGRAHFSICLRILEYVGCIKMADNEWIPTGGRIDERPGDIRQLWNSALRRFPAYFAELCLLDLWGTMLPKLLRGEADFNDVLSDPQYFPLFEHLFQDAPAFYFSNRLISQTVALAVANLPKSSTVRILEIGAGCGGLTAHLLPKLSPERTEYVFSDENDDFFETCEHKFSAYPFVGFTLLAIGKGRLEKDCLQGDFDIVVARGLDRADDLRSAVENTRRLLAPGGLLVEDIGPRNPVSRIVYGLAQDGRSDGGNFGGPFSPDFSKSLLESLLAEAGFSEIVSIPENAGPEPVAQILLAKGPAAVSVEENDPSLPERTVEDTGIWLFFADSSGVAERLSSHAESYGAKSIFVYCGDCFRRMDADRFEVSARHPEDMQKLLSLVLEEPFPESLTVVHLWGLDYPSPENPDSEYIRSALLDGCCGVTYFIRAWTEMDVEIHPRLTIVTRRGQQTGPETESVAIEASSLIGMGRVVAREHPELGCKLVDLGANTGDVEIENLFEEIVSGSQDNEEEIALRGEDRYVSRLVRTTFAGKKRVPVGSDECFGVEVETPGLLDKLALKQRERLEPGKGQVKIKVETAALNFRDVMKALGIYPSDGVDSLSLGDECAGTVVSVGEGVADWKTGDQVVALAPGCLGSHAITSAFLTIGKHPAMSFQEAVTIPVAFLTAYHALMDLGRMRPGDRVLVHAGTGGVGMAAIQIARLAGAEVFATAGSSAKRQFLRSMGIRHVMDSRSLDFAEEIMEITQGKGVDLVVNSLAGEAIAKGLSVLAPHGRFLEIGKRDIYQNTKLGLKSFRNNISFSAVDLGQVMQSRPSDVREKMFELLRHFEKGELAPIPHRVFPVGGIAEAFRCMAQAKHMGKIVVSMNDAPVEIEPLVQGKALFKEDATYLVTGGLGGFGLAVAEWMARKGARNLVLAGRSGASSDKAKKALAKMRGQGVHVVAARADVSLLADVERMLSEIADGMPPLRGLIHGAMVLDNGWIATLDQERFEKVISPKAIGAWNLHVATRDLPLDFFVMISSVASVIGSPNQANYVAANAFLDSLALYREKMGLPALAINWGQLAEVGFVARNEKAAQWLNRAGLTGIPPDQATEALGKLLPQKRSQAIIVLMDWRKWAGTIGKSKVPARYLRLTGTAGEGDKEREEDGIRDAMAAASPEEGLRLLESYIRDHVAKVLEVSVSKIETSRPLTDLGLDSLMAVELKSRFEDDLGTVLPTMELMKGPSIARLSSLIIGQIHGGEKGL